MQVGRDLAEGHLQEYQAPDTQPKGQAPATWDPASKKDAVLQRLPILAAR